MAKNPYTSVGSLPNIISTSAGSVWSSTTSATTLTTGSFTTGNLTAVGGLTRIDETHLNSIVVRWSAAEKDIFKIKNKKTIELNELIFWLYENTTGRFNYVIGTHAPNTFFFEKYEDALSFKLRYDGD